MSALVRVGCSYEILVFDDGSQDNTAAVVTAFQAAHPQAPVRLFRNKFNRGLAFNFVEAAFQGRGTYYRAVLATTSSRRNQSSRSSARVERQMSSFPISWRFRNRPFRRTVISKLYTRLVNLASGYRLAYYNGNPLYRRSHVHALSCRVLRVRLSGGIPHAR